MWWRRVAWRGVPCRGCYLGRGTNDEKEEGSNNTHLGAVYCTTLVGGREEGGRAYYATVDRGPAAGSGGRSGLFGRAFLERKNGNVSQ